jgi:DNA-binding response OmpR family regulator
MLRVMLAGGRDCLPDTLSAILAITGHEVVRAADLVDAASAVEVLTPDVVLLDLGGGGAAAGSVARAVRRAGRAKVLLIGVAASDPAKERPAIREAGIDLALTGPVDVNALLETLRLFEESLALLGVRERHRGGEPHRLGVGGGEDLGGHDRGLG